MDIITPSSDPTQKASSTDIDVLSYLFYRALGTDQPGKLKSVASSPIQRSKNISSLDSSPPPSPKRPGSKAKRTKFGSRNRSSRNNNVEVHPGPPKQPFDALLVFDVEATCVEDSDFNWCNEIIEWPVVLLRWSDKALDGRARQLIKVDEFRTFVRPTFRPILSDFCSALTGISQDNVQDAPTFPEMLNQFKDWLVKHSLLCPETGHPLQRFMWCTDGPYDIRDFVVKQSFISGVTMPQWLYSEVMDVRKAVTNWLLTREENLSAQQEQANEFRKTPPGHLRRPSLNICRQLQALSLAPFEGRQHCGIDDTRNIARIVTELARLGHRLEPNIAINPKRRWHWMGPRLGEIYSDYL